MAGFVERLYPLSHPRLTHVAECMAINELDTPGRGEPYLLFNPQTERLFIQPLSIILLKFPKGKELSISRS